MGISMLTRIINRKRIRKGILFSIISIIIVGVLVSMVLIMNEHKSREPFLQNNVRVIVINSYITSLFDFSKEALYLSSIKAFNNLSRYVEYNGLFNDKSEVETALFNCIVNNTLPNDEQCMQENYTFNSLLKLFINNSRDRLGVQTEYNISSISLEESLPFEISVNMNVNYSIKDISAEWDMPLQSINTNISVNNIEDPLFDIVKDTYNYAGERRLIKETNIPEYSWNKGNLKEFISNGEYRYNTIGAPSFISRYIQGFPASSCCGIESMIFPDDLSIRNKDNRSFTDWQIAKDIQSKCFTIRKVDWISGEYIYLDTAHTKRYNVTEDGNGVCE